MHGADREVAYVVLIVAVLSLACFVGLELSLNVMEKSDMARVKVKERLVTHFIEVDNK